MLKIHAEATGELDHFAVGQVHKGRFQPKLRTPCLQGFQGNGKSVDKLRSQVGCVGGRGQAQVGTRSPTRHSRHNGRRADAEGSLNAYREQHRHQTTQYRRR